MIDNSPYISTVTSDDSSSYEASLLNSRNRIHPLFSLCNASDKNRYPLNAPYDLDFTQDSAFPSQDSAFSNNAYGYPSSSLFRSRRFSLDDPCSAMDSRPLNGNTLLSESSLLRSSWQHRSISFPYASSATESSFLIPEALPRDEFYCGDSYCFASSRRGSIGAHEFSTLLSETWVARDRCDSLKQSSFRFQETRASVTPSQSRTQARDSDASSQHASDSSHSEEVASSEEVKTMKAKVAPSVVVNKSRERKAPIKKPAPVNTNEPPGNPDDIDPVAETTRGEA